MRTSFDDWLAKSDYRWDARTGMSFGDQTVRDMMRAAYRAGTQSDELDRAVELLRMVQWARSQHVDLSETEAKLIDAFLREISG